ncbi:inactive pancreatic lipase-related protein 1-like isoform X2 [Gigantopelta aegis]|uniref:inactive pancreatic lipase-related protein 1-like isoform X2 n=1 Tax=Gigantopelta aegis TaxID=1735272 RepID=UPI001B88A8DA|nr:inactive pancreatic lipase-related protein 1-like isoform X2 [Gigantopelta aegis]
MVTNTLFLFWISCFSLVNAFLFKSHVCYGDLGCFSQHGGFDNAMGELPASPEQVHVTMNLFSRDNPVDGQILSYQDTTSISDSNFNSERDVKVIIHGYHSYGRAPWVLNMTKYLLDLGDFNVIVVDWKNGANDIYYPESAANTRVVGAIVAKLVSILHDEYQVDLKNVHLIGHSLGAHVCGYIGTRVPGIGRITGLDPAGPLFNKAKTIARLDPSDAIFVDNIHTDAEPIYDAGLGTLAAWGHIDFYPNGGKHQDGCPYAVYNSLEDVIHFHFSEIKNDVVCSHIRSHDYFTESLTQSDCQFVAYPCTSYEDFTSGKCTSCGSSPCPIMGYFSEKYKRTGKFYLNTHKEAPFCKKNMQ